ncbi:MAG: hemin ABC transporter substrate-binding protein [Gammaproteobacteria bacterium]|nr:MAG: hemin ABC transporter substrate-binding protein [Gammaproteobacteria bacterium]
MKAKLTSILLGLLLSFSLGAASSQTPPQRLVVAGGGLTEIVYAIGGEAALVGVDSTSQYPKAAQALPGVGYMRALSAEGVLSLKPDALLLTDEAGPPPVLAILRQSGLPLHTLKAEYSMVGLLQHIAYIGELLGRSEQSQALAAQIRQQQQVLQQRIARQQRTHAAPKVLFLLTHAGRSPMAAGANTAAHALIELAGGRNVVSDFSGYRPLSQEAIASLQPDLILTTEQGLEQLGGAEALLNKAGIKLTAAARQRQLLAMDALLLLGFGPRTVQAASTLNQRLYPTVPKAQ